MHIETVYDWVAKGFRYVGLVGVLIVTAYASPSWSWSQKGHAWIAQSAAQELPENVLAYYEDLLKEGIVVPPKFYHASLAERIGAMAVWPDTVRDVPLKKLFKQYGGEAVPKALQPWAETTTADWHYTNAHYVNEQGGALDPEQCAPATTGQLVTVWPELVKAFGEAQSAKAKNVVLALALHLAADAYQPLHLLSAVDKSCKSDRGGNGTCVSQKPGSKDCEVNLHQLWDQGFDVFSQPLAWPTQKHPTNFLSMKDAIKLAQTAALDVYTQDGHYKTAEYFNRGQVISQLGADYAVGHCVFLLKYFMAYS